MSPTRPLLFSMVTLAVAACSNGSSSSTPAATNGANGIYTPEGCAFQVGTREQYTDWKADHAASGTGAANVRRVRLGLGGNLVAGPGYADPSSSIAFAWQTNDGDFGTEVRWGTQPEPSSWNPADRATGITWQTPQGTIAPQGDERMHEAYVCGLKPQTSYYYQVLSGAEKSEVYGFKTTPADGTSEVTLAITGDSRGQNQNAWQLLQRRIRERAVTMQLFSGDMVNLAGSQTDWESWIDNAWKDDAGKSSAAPSILTLHTHGNHENHTPLYFGNIVTPQSPETHPKYLEAFYSFQLGALHVVVIDDFAIGSPTIDPDYANVVKDWLETDLAAANAHRAERPWVIAMHHHGEYSSSSHGTDADVLRDREFFVPIWEAAGVNMVFNGHDHNYERSHPLKAGTSVDAPQTDPAGTTYVVCAGAGAEGYGAGTSSFTAYSASYGDVGPHIGVYGVLTATMTDLKWQAYWLDAAGESQVEPEVVFKK